MAELVRIEASNFRAFEHVTLELGPRGLVLVTGANNAGKSALLSLLDVVGGATPEGAPHRGRPWEDVEVVSTWRLDEREWPEVLSNPMAAPSEPLRVDTRRRLRIKHTGSSLEPRGLTVPLRGGGAVEQTLEGYWTLNLKEILAKWCTGHFHFHPLRQTSGRTAPLRNVTPVLQPDGGNLATVLLHLQTNDRPAWARLGELVREILPDVGELAVRVNGDSCEIGFLPDEGRAADYRNLKELGTGVEQLLMLLVVGLTGTARTIVLEDPEIGLHPSAQRALLGLLQEWSRDRLILAATHSAAMLDWSSPSTTVLNVRRQDGVSTVSTVTNDRIQVLRDLGIRLSDVLAADRLLVLEGPTDKAVLDVWFAEQLRHPRVAVLAGGGGADARQADLLARWLADADRLEERRVLFVRDRDELPEGEVTRLVKQGNVFVLPVREVENLLLDAQAVARFVNAEREGAGLTAEQAETVMRKAADDLEETVVLKRVLAGLAPVRLTDNRLRGRLARDRADADSVAAAVTARLPLREDVEAEIRRSWTAHTTAVRNVWDTDWRQLAPGADVLKAVLQEFLGRGYRKDTDGPALARLIPQPPAALRRVFDAFMAGG
ncbi:AAA family ATPase [Kitasatospora phosalacinea]|uniref:AAA family ATPase n=1 Tax=Kitasatospora phosalacinea TaxID=2065 RepID=A0ABW6GTL1_9ACTN